ncbi:lipoyl(octanoyl) transferase LipB [Polymorphobacter sp.]|uniref:lipoyl(octanoyl) transferase LipB n=1 Tax=Polymorphobacter sp. TaxID=1909290 RepID=UPI003F716919
MTAVSEMTLELPQWRISPGLADYAETLAAMEAHVRAMQAGTADELVWLVEHPPLYTAGTSARIEELLDPQRFPVFNTGRGGRYTYHGPGQRVAYVMLDLSRRGRDLRCFVAALEAWVIAVLADVGVEGFLVPEKVGVWVDTPAGAAKIAALGVRVSRWISYHGIALNIDPDLENYSGIQPCGLAEPVTSLRALGAPAAMAAVDRALATRLPAMLAQLGH